MLLTALTYLGKVCLFCLLFIRSLNFSMLTLVTVLYSLSCLDLSNLIRLNSSSCLLKFLILLSFYLIVSRETIITLTVSLIHFFININKLAIIPHSQTSPAYHPGLAPLCIRHNKCNYFQCQRRQVFHIQGKGHYKNNA